MMMRLLHRLRADRRGVAAVELALAAPVLAALVAGTIDFSNAFARKLTLEQAAQRGIEKAFQTTDFKTVQDTIKSEVSSAANVPESKVSVTYTLTCNGTSQDFDTECEEGKIESRYLAVSVSDTYTPLFLQFFTAKGMNSFNLNGSAGIRTT
jgi:Flp pilus assembly pilin Flp